MSIKYILFVILILFFVNYLRITYNKGYQSEDKLFLIHNYKVMGTTIYRQLPYEYNKKYYGRITTLQYEKRNNVDLPILREKYGTEEKISFDHIQLDELLEVGILNKSDIRNLKCVGFMRNTIERFLSICSFEKKSPEKIIDEIKGGRNLTQIYHFKNRNPWHIYIFLDNDKSNIISWFKKFNIDLNLHRRYNVSEKIYFTDSLTQQQLQFIRNYFKEDDLLISILNNRPGPLKLDKN